MFQRFVISIFFAVLAVPSFAGDVLVPVVTGTAGNRTFRTTIAVTNGTKTAAQCVFTYRSLGRADHPLVSNETIAAGQVRVYEDFLVEVDAAGTIRVGCTDGVELVTRLQESSDAGKTFRAGRLFRPFLADHVIKEGAPHTTRAATDVAIAEVAGKPVHVEVSAANFGGVEYAHAAYDVPPYALRIVSLADVLQKLSATDVTVTVSGKGAIVIGKETREPALANVALHRTEAQKAPQVVALSAPPSSSVIAMLGISSFKAAPFVEPMTGDIYMRDRWYDPHTGTFLSPDPEGYAGGANLYSYCHGDPVNCSDPTGRLGDGGDLRADFRAKENAELQRRAAAWCRANPVECAKREVRGGAIMRGIGGAGQTVAGVSAFSATGPLPEPVTKTFGAITAARGIENIGTAAIEFWTGEPRDTGTRRVMYLALIKAGQSPAQASRISGWAETGLDVATSLGSGYIAARAQQLNALVELRIAYETDVRSLSTIQQQLAAAGRTEEEIARALSAQRRSIGIQYKDLTPAAERESIYARNLTKYGDQYGPTVDYLRSQGKTWAQIIESAQTPSGADILPPAVASHPDYVRYTGSAKLQ
mgnify:CR=1 FL=1